MEAVLKRYLPLLGACTHKPTSLWGLPRCCRPRPMGRRSGQPPTLINIRDWIRDWIRNDIEIRDCSPHLRALAACKHIFHSSPNYNIHNKSAQGATRLFWPTVPGQVDQKSRLPFLLIFVFTYDIASSSRARSCSTSPHPKKPNCKQPLRGGAASAHHDDSCLLNCSPQCATSFLR